MMLSEMGFKTAMQEGFAGSDVANHVKTVITFRGDHLVSQSPIPKDNELWETKPSTAELSLAGAGEIYPEDIKMISFRFPIHYYPERLLSEDEINRRDEDKMHFVVRHYVPHKKTAH
jgi:hypothetical protein